MRVTAYAYPWDLARLGVERVLGEMAEHGIAAVDLAATYHPIDALSPRDGHALFTSPRGAVHFPARVARYGRIQPSLSPDPEIRAVWPAIARAAPSYGLALNAWTVVLFQPWIADAYLDCARVLPSGDPIGSGVCPASEDVREYLAALCADIAEQFGVETLRLEGIMPAAYDYGWLRPRVLVEVSALARQLLALCFCTSCIRRAADRGIDVERVRRTVNEAIAAEIDPLSGSGRADRVATLLADAEHLAFVVQHEQASIELARAAVSRIEAGRAPRVSTIAWTPYSLLLGDAQRPMLAELLGAVDQILVFPAGDVGHARTVADLAAASTRRVGLATFVAPVHLGALAGMTSPPGDETERIEQELRASSTFAIEEVNVYNYGLIRGRDLQALMASISAVLS